MNTILSVQDGTLELRRFPLRQQETLQAWDASDEYLIEHIIASNLPKNSHLMIFNDSFGALACWGKQQGFRVTAINDSLIAQTSMMENAAANQLAGIVQLQPLDSLPSDIDLVVLKLPKSNRLLIWQLEQIAMSTPENQSIVAGAKVKDIHSSTLKLFETHLGETKTSLAKKKSRLIFTSNQKPIENKQPEIKRILVDKTAIQLSNYPNVFSSERLDPAAYLMLDHIPRNPNFKHIIDLGCGNGVIAIHAAKSNPQSAVTAVDESHLAIASATLNAVQNEVPHIQCRVNDCLNNFESQSADLILCNPPFHQSNTVTDHIAWQMFCDAKRVLATGGKLQIIGNRHLGYHIKLKRLFGNCRTLASNAKFVILEAVKNTNHKMK